MDKHLMITVSEDTSCMHGVRFVGSFFNNMQNLRATLLSIAPRLPASNLPELMDSWYDRSDSDMVRSTTGIEKSLAVASRLLHRKGMRKDHIDIRIKTRQLSKGKDIINEGHSGLYDAVVLGRRGASMIETLFSESVSDEMLAEEIDFPLWICRDIEEGRNNVLLCVDGSDASLRMADHVGFMLNQESSHRITILHVDSGDDGNKEFIINRAKERLLDNGIAPGIVSEKVIQSKRVLAAILKETKKNNFAVVAAGLVGHHYSGLKGLFVGSTSSGLAEKLTRAALWVRR